MVTGTSNKPARKHSEYLDRFHPDMPQIPGVNNARPGTSPANIGQNGKRVAQIGGLVVVALLGVIAILWRVRSVSHHGTSTDAEMPEASVPLPEPAIQALPTPISDGPTVVATAKELAKPWSSKTFVFVKPFPRENVDAIAVRLPGKGLWAFALQEPYGDCKLEFVTDLSRIANQYGYRASHPMVVNPCNNTVYDPLKVGPLGGSVWARGEIVQGSGLRPPMAINLQEKGQSIVADRME